MLGIARLAAETAGGSSGGDSGISVIVLAVYGGIFVFALIAWIGWAIRQEQGGVIQWGEEPPAEGFGHKLARMWRTASAPPTPSSDAPPLEFFADEHEQHETDDVEERQRRTG